MAFRDKIGRLTQTVQDARGAENSRGSYYVLLVSLGLAAAAGVALFWYFEVFAAHA